MPMGARRWVNAAWCVTSYPGMGRDATSGANRTALGLGRLPLQLSALAGTVRAVGGLAPGG